MFEEWPDLGGEKNTLQLLAALVLEALSWGRPVSPKRGSMGILSMLRKQRGGGVDEEDRNVEEEIARNLWVRACPFP